mmetsp:Transcript_80732/g.223319  ORF Transcript_80732/g.223319 Transcript_80732/m.223319 type:complete len:85 (+) Transcript_80732:371-625(+)
MLQTQTHDLTSTVSATFEHNVNRNRQERKNAPAGIITASICEGEKKGPMIERANRLKANPAEDAEAMKEASSSVKPMLWNTDTL